MRRRQLFRNLPTFAVAWILVATVANICVAQVAMPVPVVAPDPVLTVRNDMGDAVYFWIKSESQKEWKYFIIAANGGTQRIRLTSPDRFELHSCDTQGGDFYLGLRPLKSMLQQDPNMVVTLGGIVATGQFNERFWSSREGGWRWRRRVGQARMAVTYNYHFSNGQIIQDPANRR